MELPELLLPNFDVICYKAVMIGLVNLQFFKHFLFLEGLISTVQWLLLHFLRPLPLEESQLEKYRTLNSGMRI